MLTRCKYGKDYDKEMMINPNRGLDLLMADAASSYIVSW